MDRWCSWLTHLPVTQEIAGPSPVRSAMNNFSRQILNNLNIILILLNMARKKIKRGIGVKVPKIKRLRKSGETR